MQITALNQHRQTAEVLPEHLAGNKNLSEGDKIAEASRQFEAILIRQILEGATKAVIKSNLSDDSTTASIYHDMMTTHLADSISKSGALGLAQTFERQLNRSSAPDPKTSSGGVPPSVSDSSVVRPHSVAAAELRASPSAYALHSLKPAILPALHE